MPISNVIMSGLKFVPNLLGRGTRAIGRGALYTAKAVGNAALATGNLALKVPVGYGKLLAAHPLKTLGGTAAVVGSGATLLNDMDTYEKHIDPRYNVTEDKGWFGIGMRKESGILDNAGKIYGYMQGATGGALNMVRSAPGGAMDAVNAFAGLKRNARFLKNMETIGKGVAGTALLLGPGMDMLGSLLKASGLSFAQNSLIKKLMEMDQIIKSADPEQVLSFYKTICNMAPKVSTDENVVKDLLHNFIKFGRIDMQSLKILVETEKLYTDAKKNMRVY